MTIDLDKLEQQRAAATPGPWTNWGKIPLVVRIETPNGDPLVYHDPLADDGQCITEGDAEWMTAIHDAAPALIAELREARAAIERVKALAYDPDDADEYAPTAIVVDATLLQRALDGARD